MFFSCIRDEAQLPRQLKTQPSQPVRGAVSDAGPWRGLAVGVVGGRIEVEVGEKGKGGGGGDGDRGLP